MLSVSVKNHGKTLVDVGGNGRRLTTGSTRGRGDQDGHEGGDGKVLAFRTRVALSFKYEACYLSISIRIAR